jgi:hypothetical protein
MRRAEIAVLETRLAVTKALLEKAVASNASSEAVGKLWGISPPGFRLNKYAIDQPPSDAKTRARFIQSARRAIHNQAVVDALRERVGRLAATHAQGNGTVHAIAQGAANALDCDVLAIDHSKDRFLHRAKVRDRMRLAFPVVKNNAITDTAFAPADEEILIEENPLERVETGAEPHKHADLFPVIRRGFERTLLRVIVTGTGGRTIGPMLVNRDEGKGVAFAGTVPEGATLVINEEGRALLDNVDVTARAYSWKGASFAEGSQPHRRDFVFAGPGAAAGHEAKFAEATPEGALGAMFAFPHAGESIVPLGIDVGESRFAFFVQEGFFSSQRPDLTIDRVEPRPAVAFVDGSAFAPGAGEERQTAALLSLSWLERCAFRARVWIPRRFLLFTPEDQEGRATRKQVLDALERFRPAGVRLDVEFIDNRWVLGRGVIFGEQAPPEQGPGIGMELWSAPEE